ncbi:MAG TPA: glycerate kinase, partial [Flavitalea sp.]|nr:glycerate kinase [Flavitalea sp.]
MSTINIIIAPDKFKGSLTSFDVCRIIESALLEQKMNFRILPFPLADGGDGFAAVMRYYLRTETIACLGADALGRRMETSYQWEQASLTAIIELASTSGLLLLKEPDRNPMNTSTYGTGLVIQDAVTRGAQKIILGLGGSATNDAGMGILSALGFRLLDKNGKTVPPSGQNLSQIHSIIPPAQKPTTQFHIACDVDNVLYGDKGAAKIYAPQKGAD